jgi:hypothetical protein
MTDQNFDALLERTLRTYAHGGVRPIDAMAIAETTIARGSRSRGFRFPARSTLRLALVGLALVGLVVGAAIVGSRLSRPEPVGPLPRIHTGELAPAGDLAMARAWPILVELQNGRVLVLDGAAGLETTAETYDPARGSLGATGPMVSAEALSISSAIRLRDGRVLVVGDARPFDGPSFGVAQTFDPATSTFATTGPMVTDRALARLAMLPDGRVLVAGGTPPNRPNTALSSAEIFDPASGKFTPTGELRTPRQQHALVSLGDGSVLVIGGETTYSEAGSQPPGIEVYDPTTGSFSAASSPVDTLITDWERGGGVTAALRDGRVIAFGQPIGAWSEPGPASTPDDPHMTAAVVWDPATGTLRRIAAGLPEVKNVASLDDGRVLVTGSASRDASWVGIFDPATGTMDRIQTPSAWDPTLMSLSDGRVLLVGGLTDGNGRPENGGSLAPAVPTVQILQ